MSKQLQVVIVDDDADYAATTAMLVRQMGYEARTFLCADDALTGCTTHVPDVLLADIGMPHMNGYDLAARIRENPSLRGIVLAAVTGHGDEEARRKAIHAGFDYRFVKPLERDELCEFLRLIASS